MKDSQILIILLLLNSVGSNSVQTTGLALSNYTQQPIAYTQQSPPSAQAQSTAAQMHGNLQPQSQNSYAASAQGNRIQTAYLNSAGNTQAQVPSPALPQAFPSQSQVQFNGQTAGAMPTYPPQPTKSLPQQVSQAPNGYTYASQLIQPGSYPVQGQ